MLLKSSLNGQGLNYYYGNIHAHTAYSDGNKEGNVSYDCPSESYLYAKNSQHFDFLGISEHNHFGAGMTVKANYANGLSEATFQNQDGTFVCMYGMEWGVISGGGHVILYGVNELIGWDAGLYDIYNAKFDYDGLFKKVARYPSGSAFAYLAHPDTADYSNLLRNAWNSTYDSAIVGAAIRSGPAFSVDTSYNNPSTSLYETRYREALSLGYHLGAGLDHDNHYTTFGRMAQSRLVVLAPSLTRSNIMDGIKKMRMYSSDDWNVKVNFTINGQPLGSVFSASGNPTISVSVSDDDGESTSKIALCYGIPGSGVLSTTLTSVTNTPTLNYIHNIANGASYYYYLQVRQPDGNRVYTSPIWFTRNDIVLPIELLSFGAVQQEDAIALNWQTASETNNHYFTIESSLNGIDFKKITTLDGAGNSTTLQRYQYTDSVTCHNLNNGLIYYRLKQTDYNQNSNYSQIVSVNYQLKNHISNVQVFPVPATNAATLKLQSKSDMYVNLNLTDMMGQTLLEIREKVFKGENAIGLQLPPLANGTYVLKIMDSYNQEATNRLITIYNP